MEHIFEIHPDCDNSSDTLNRPFDISLAASLELSTNPVGNSGLYAVESSDEMLFLEAPGCGGNVSESEALPPAFEDFGEQNESGGNFPVSSSIAGDWLSSSKCTQPGLDVATNSRGQGVLSDWYYGHYSHPYPTKDEMSQLSEASGKSVKQLRCWFTNKRSRDKTRSRSNQSLSKETHIAKSMNLDGYNIGSSFEHSRYPSMLHESIETSVGFDHGIAIGDICNALNLSTTQSIGANQVDSAIISGSLGVPPNSQASTAACTRSPTLQHAIGRKGKRQAHSLGLASDLSVSKHMGADLLDKPFACTLGCGKCFKDKYDWKKHEATHLPEMWLCMPDGSPPIVCEHCAFCGLFDPRISHFKTHFEIDKCLHSPPSARRFARKDHLRNHIDRVHVKRRRRNDKGAITPRNGVGPDLLDGWYREPVDLALQYPAALWCGFCQIRFESRSERVDHVGTHFQRGDVFSAWTVLS